MTERARQEIDAASVKTYRAVFGALMLVAVIRTFAHGWIAEYFLEPKVFFHYLGFGWVKPWPGIGMYVHFAIMGALAICVMAGFHPRKSVAAFGVLFAYAHLIDKTNYLNHYYLIGCLCVLLAVLPITKAPTVPRWVLWALRTQIAVVWIFGGIAKLDADWLIHAQPMRTWLAASTDFPIIGGLLDSSIAAHVASIAGALFDLSIVPLLLWPKTRKLAYLAVIAFHLATMKLFNLGMFPWLMMASSLLFLPPDWPRRLLNRASVTVTPAARPMARPMKLFLGVWFALQLVLPLRHFLYPGHVTWTEEGFRFAWNVMRIEKVGSVDATVVEPSTNRTWAVSPRSYLTPQQARMMSTQPDMILEYAHIVAADFRARGIRDPQVFVSATVVLNGRAPALLVNPAVDLAAETDGLTPRTWISR